MHVYGVPSLNQHVTTGHNPKEFKEDQNGRLHIFVNIFLNLIDANKSNSCARNENQHLQV